MLNNKFKKIKSIKALVIGDFMLDSYITGSINRISPEAPVPVLHQRTQSFRLGGAGNVVLNIVSLGGRVRVVGRVGDDDNGDILLKEFNRYNIDKSFLIKDGKTIVKTRIGTKNQQVARIDDEEFVSPSDKQIDYYKKNISKIFDNIDVVIISDYNKGFLSPKICSLFINEAKKRKICVFVDPKGNSLDKYKGATSVTPNYKEFCELFGLNSYKQTTESQIKYAAIRKSIKLNFDFIVITRSEKGISIVTKKDKNKLDFPIVPKSVIDVTGAGDTVIAVFSVLYTCGFSLQECAKLANYAASIVISKFGAVPITYNELIQKYENYKLLSNNQDIKKIALKLKSEQKRIVFTNGCFDILHAGHIKSFLEARQMGDVLMVGVNSDDSIRRLKGKTRPIICLEDRITLLSQLSCIDFVIPFNEDTPINIIRLIKPDILVKGADWKNKEVVGASYIKQYGGKVMFIDLKKFLSTSSIINKIKKIC